MKEEGSLGDSKGDNDSRKAVILGSNESENPAVFSSPLCKVNSEIVIRSVVAVQTVNENPGWFEPNLVIGSGSGCPEKLWMPPPWQGLRPGWTGL